MTNPSAAARKIETNRRRLVVPGAGSCENRNVLTTVRLNFPSTGTDRRRDVVRLMASQPPEAGRQLLEEALALHAIFTRAEIRALLHRPRE